MALVQPLTCPQNCPTTFRCVSETLWSSLCSGETCDKEVTRQFSEKPPCSLPSLQTLFFGPLTVS